MSDPFTRIDLDLPRNSYMIECTNTQSFEERENYASTISVEHLDLFHIPGYDMKLFGYNMILFVENIVVIDVKGVQRSSRMTKK